ncbi:MAG: cation-translocating P-type ATPase, partial [Myxococcales bacterium]
RLARVIAALATGLGALFFAVGWALGLPLGHTLLFAVGILVANVPEGLLPTVTLSLAMASQRMARRNALVRKLPAVETLGSATVICTDKTGTLTQNRMQIAGIFCGGALHPAREARALSRAYAPLFEGAALCHDLVVTDGHRRGDPMEIALVEMGEDALGARPPAERIAELPFDGERRRLTTLHRAGRGLVLHAKGAFEDLLPLCARELVDGGEWELDAARRAALLREAEALADHGLRVLAFASGTPAAQADLVALERGLAFSGLVAFEDPPRPEVPEALERCRAAGIRVIMVTGDHPRTALAVARDIGLVRGDPRLLTGAELRALSDAALDVAVRAPELIVARAHPADKRLIVEALRRNGEVVAVTGDGANDAPALRDADIGIAMGKSGTDVARDAADLVLLDDNFASIVAAVEEGRAVFANIRKFMTYILTSNVPELLPYLAFVLLRVPLALTILQILAVDLGTDMLPALALGAEPPGPDAMLRPPRRRGERLFDASILIRAYAWLGVLEAAGAMAAFFLTLHGGGWRWGEEPVPALYVEATTACLAAIVIMQIANVFLCRSENGRLQGLRENRLLLFGIAVELTLLAAIVYTPPGRAIFGTAPLALADWLYALPFAAAMIALEQGRKAWVRRRRDRARLAAGCRPARVR